MGGIGKTWLSIKLVEQIQSAFEVVLWRSLRPVLRSQFPLTVDDLLDDLLKHLDPSSAASPSATTHGKIRRLINHLREKAMSVSFRQCRVDFKQRQLRGCG